MNNDFIELVPYNNQWPKMAALEIKKLRESLPMGHIIDIQHVGSTAIPKMLAKPIIDIQITVDSLAAIKQVAIDILKNYDYVYWDEDPDIEKMFFVKGMPPFGEKRTHHIHIIEPKSKRGQNRIIFRDYLIAHPEIAGEYEQLKIKLAQAYAHDREKYTDAKTEFIEYVLCKARKAFQAVKQYPMIIFLTGASGAGKTTILDVLSKKLSASSITCLHFDNIGVPTEQEMIANYGSGSEWQKAMTYRWIQKLINNYQNKKLVILEGQVNLDFIISAFEGFNFYHYKIILAHCENIIRHTRLYQDRHQPELINDTMDNWAEFLKKQAIDKKAMILDTTLLSTDEMVSQFEKLINAERFI
jgi:GrpB-like predicted nucleotidyltransferase (UPF0157 family)